MLCLGLLITLTLLHFSRTFHLVEDFYVFTQYFFDWVQNKQILFLEEDTSVGGSEQGPKITQKKYVDDNNIRKSLNIIKHYKTIKLYILLNEFK